MYLFFHPFRLYRLRGTGQGVLGHNAYAYCGDNPVLRIDPSGAWWEEFWAWLFGGGNSCAGNSSNTVEVVEDTVEFIAPNSDASPAPTLPTTPVPDPTPSPTPTPSKSVGVINDVVNYYKSGVYDDVVYSKDDKIDCQWFVKDIYNKTGHGLGVNKGSSEMFKQMVEDQTNWITSETTGLQNWALEAGDFVFWDGGKKCDCVKNGKKDCTRYNRIHHIGIYIGNGNILDNGPKTNVSIRPLKDVPATIVGYARKKWK